ncbi:hypothetical protein [Streptomyces prasinosporus]|uniref:hypothetical protein n=1 Tax=Streptomyces prasinosporus TaxID=68256 RepID=UPI0031EF66D9
MRRVLRHALRCALVLRPPPLWWTAAVLLVPRGRPPPGGRDVTVEAAAILALALAGRGPRGARLGADRARVRAVAGVPARDGRSWRRC